MTPLVERAHGGNPPGHPEKAECPYFFIRIKQTSLSCSLTPLHGRPSLAPQHLLLIDDREYGGKAR